MPTNLKLIFHLAVHAAWGVVELVRTCDNLTFSCGHFNKHLLPLLGCSGSHKPPGMSLPAPGSCAWLRYCWPREAGGARGKGRFWTLILRLLLQLLNPWQVPEMGLFCPYLWGHAWGSWNGVSATPGAGEAQEGRHGVSGASPSAPSPAAPALALWGKKLKELLFIWLFAALFCGEMLRLTQVHIKHRCRIRPFKIINRWKKISVRWLCVNNSHEARRFALAYSAISMSCVTCLFYIYMCVCCSTWP